jgi:hypothetical protein
MVDLVNIVESTEKSFDKVNDALYEIGVTDGLPVVPPTAARVKEMLQGKNPNKVIGLLPPVNGEASLYRLAICAVMAGCLPDYFPLLTAVVEAVSKPEFNLLAVQTTTGAAAPLILVNGPVIDKIKLNSGCNVLGPGVRSNATIGRALSLVLRNIGGAIPGIFDLSTLGQPGKYTFCIAENEKASQWEPFHVSRGLKKENSAVTVIAVNGTIEVRDELNDTACGLLTTFAKSMISAGSVANIYSIGGGEPLILLSPDHAKIIGREMSRREAQKFLFENACLPISFLSEKVKKYILEKREALDHEKDDNLRAAKRAENILLLIAGGMGVKSCFIPSWGGVTKSVTVEIEN